MYGTSYVRRVLWKVRLVEGASYVRCVQCKVCLRCGLC